MRAEDLRFHVPIFTVKETSNHLDIPATTVARWMDTRVRGTALVHRLPAESSRAPSVPFIAVVEAYVLRILRTQGMQLGNIRHAVQLVRSQFGDEYALASRRIANDGVTLFINVGAESGLREWMRARDGQGTLRGTVEQSLRQIDWGSDGFARRLHLPKYKGADVIVDPRFGLGQPVLRDQKVRVVDLVESWWGGDSLDVIAHEYRVPVDQVEATIRAATRIAA
jgi:uncharacterized protein (DUF433 family)